MSQNESPKPMKVVVQKESCGKEPKKITKGTQDKQFKETITAEKL